MTKDELLLKIVATESLEAAINDIIAYVKQNRSAIDANISTVNGKVTTLIGSDTAKSVRTIANEELAAQLIPANAKEALDTLQEIAAWIQNHPDDASAMNTAITNLQNLIGTLPQDTEETTVVAWVTAELAALANQISGKNVSASGETGNDALVTASASNNAVTVGSTTKLQNAVAAAESAVQPEDLGLLTVSEAQALVAAAIADSSSSNSSN
jgi:hypothetical protein